ncbi:hypothetical protein VSR01_10875 [Actinacidiphila sp. DG2A-62]|uniref:hypothetical protein n=1 Tax=Actinacidiphila sp. DG2A-62 TaxID=3108821 RepID=UPI002DBEC3D5|nr:hypothetical protein [Actinacidiphila sp. DG2A-62]MEC3994022.1 hypothetical protein [Actinacidiphila sp. DG2A-62]
MTAIAHGTNRYLCPLQCGWHHDVPPPHPADVDWSAAEGVEDVSAAIGLVARDAALRTAAVIEAALVAHLDTHTTLDFVTVIADLRAQIDALASAATPSDEENEGG